MKNPTRYFDSSPEVIRLVVMMYVKYPLSLQNVEHLLAERGIDICHETVRLDGTGSGRCSRPKSCASALIECGPEPVAVHLDEVHVRAN